MSERCPAWRRRLRCVSGQTTTEYLVLTGMVATIAITTVNLLGVSVRQTLATVANRFMCIVAGGC